MIQNIDGRPVIQFQKMFTQYIVCIDDIPCATCTFATSLPYEDEEPQIIHIVYLDVKDPHKHMGLGTMLLFEVLMDAYRNNIRIAELDDASDNCHKPNNIYVKMGFTYTHGRFDNSMRGNLRHILYGNKTYRSKCQGRFLVSSDP